MEIEIKLDKSKLRKNGFPVIITIFISKTDRQYPTTGYYAFENEWDFVRNEPKSNHPLYNGLYEFVYKTKLAINKILERKKTSYTSEQVKNILLGTNPDSLVTFWQEFIEENKKNGNEGNARYHASNLAAFKQYKSDLNFDQLTYNFIIKYRDFHLNKKQVDGNNKVTKNGVIVYLRGLKTVYREALKRKLFIPEDLSNPFEGVMPTAEPTKDKYFSIPEMKKIMSIPIKHKYYDFFILCFLIGGIDYVDLKNLKYSHIKNNRIKFERFKGGTKEIINNYIFPETYEILNKYKDDTGFLVPLHFYEAQSKTYSFRDNYIRRLRAWFKKNDIHSYFTSKTPRYTFIDIGKQTFLNRDVIKELTGHSNKDVHAIYEGKFPNHVKDEVHRKIIDSILK